MPETKRLDFHPGVSESTNAVILSDQLRTLLAVVLICVLYVKNKGSTSSIIYRLLGLFHAIGDIE